MGRVRPPHVLYGVLASGVIAIGGLTFFYNSMNPWVARTVSIVVLILWILMLAISVVFALVSRAFQNQRDLC